MYLNYLKLNVFHLFFIINILYYYYIIIITIFFLDETYFNCLFLFMKIFDNNNLILDINNV